MNLEEIKALVASRDWVRSHCEECRTKARTHHICVIEWLTAEVEKLRVQKPECGKMKGFPGCLYEASV